MAETLTLPALIESSQIETGMTIRVHQKIKDVSPDGAEKDRIQIFEGLVITVRGKDAGRTMTVRKISNGVGVERIYPLTLPSIAKIELVKMIKVARKNIGFVRDSKKRLRELKDIKLRAPAKA